jgi:ornithine cyclodeaminase
VRAGSTTLLLTQGDLLDCGIDNIDAVGECLEAMFVAHANGEFTSPPSSFLKRPECPHVADRIIGLSAYLGGSFDIEGIKWIASAHKNPERGLPRASAVIVLNDAETRRPVAIMEGALISALRTAVVQGIAARYLARSDSREVGLVGAGRIGALILHVIRHWFPNIAHYRVFDLSAERAQRFAAHMEKLGVGVEIVGGFEHALAPADIGIAATTASQAYVTADCFKIGSLFMNVSLMDPTYEHVLAADKIVVDDWIQCTHSDRVLARMNKAGLISRERIHGELGAIVNGTLPARESDVERIFWNPFGLAIEDLAVALAMYNRALALNAGMPINLVDREWDVLF